MKAGIGNSIQLLFRDRFTHSSPTAGRSPLTAFPIWQLGGASRAAEETAFNGRGAGHTFNTTGMTATAEGLDAEREWVRSFWSALEPRHTSV
jgi:hypothetical protein